MAHACVECQCLLDTSGLAKMKEVSKVRQGIVWSGALRKCVSSGRAPNWAVQVQLQERLAGFCLEGGEIQQVWNAKGRILTHTVRSFVLIYITKFSCHGWQACLKADQVKDHSGSENKCLWRFPELSPVAEEG